MKENVQIDGVDWDQLPADGADNPVDAQLEARLEELQSETDRLLVRIADLRRTVPEEVRRRFAYQLEELEHNIPASAESLYSMEPTTANVSNAAEMDQTVVDALIASLQRLQGMNQSIPQLVAKLQRAQVVLADDPGKGSSPAISKSLLITDALSRQLRLNRQHELAAKLLALQ